jgi:mono/diheme cytochrome c family protein
MMTRSKFALVTVALALLTACMALARPSGASAQTVAAPGAAVYDAHCAACHDRPDATRAPPKSALEMMSPSEVNYALTEGKMKAQGSSLTDGQRRDLVGYLNGGRGGLVAVAPQDNWTFWGPGS